MTAIALPAVRFQASYPQLTESVSVSRAGGGRAMAFVEFADAYWTIQMRTLPLEAAERLRVEAFKDACRGGLQTVLYRPRHMSVPQAYWGDANNAALADDGNLVSITGNQFSINSVTNGLTLGAGDLISASSGDYNSLFRVQSGGVAVGNAITLTVEPTVPSYIAAGAVVRFKDPVANMRVMPGSFSISDELKPTAAFTLVEIAK